MSRLTKKFLYQYSFGPTTVLERNLLSLSEIGERVGRNDFTDDTVWSYVTAFSNLLGNSEETEFDPLLKTAIGFLDNDLLQSIIDNVGKLESIFRKNTGATKFIGSELLDFSLYGLKVEVAENWQKIFRSLSETDSKLVLKLVTESTEKLKEALFQLRAVGAVAGVTVGALHTYEFEEWSSLLEEAKSYDLFRMIRTIVEFRYGEYKLPAARVAIKQLVQNSLRKSFNYVWEDLLIIILLTHLAYGSFHLLELELIKILCERCFYMGIVFGVPVRESVKEYFYNTETVVDYIERNATLFESLEANVEVVPLSMDGGKVKFLSDIIKEYIKFANGKSDDNKKQDIFSETFYNSQKGSVLLRKWLKELLSVYFHIKNADLIDRNHGGELTEKDLFHNDMVQLLAWFGIGADAGGVELINYFAKDNPRVSFKVFLKNLREVADLGLAITIENIMELTDLAHKNFLLPKEADIIIFDESDNQFHWNESAFV